MLSKTLNSPPRVGGRRGMIASVATTAGLSAQRSAEGLSPRRGGGGTTFWYNTPSAALVPLTRGTILEFGQLLYHYQKF